MNKFYENQRNLRGILFIFPPTSPHPALQNKLLNNFLLQSDLFNGE